MSKVKLFAIMIPCFAFGAALGEIVMNAGYGVN